MVPLLLSLMVGCAPIYVPVANNTPMFTGKNEFKAMAGIGYGVNLQAAYACTDHLAVTANYLYRKFDEDTNGIKHQYGEIALGYYVNFDQRGCFELFVGYGLGAGSAFDSAYNWFSVFGYNVRYEAAGKYHKAFIQPSIGLTEGRKKWNLSVRLNYVDFTDVHVQLNEDVLLDKRQSRLFITPAATMLFPLWRNKIYGTAQVGYNRHVGQEPDYDYDSGLLMLGLTYSIKKRKEKL